MYYFIVLASFFVPKANAATCKPIRSYFIEENYNKETKETVKTWGYKDYGCD